MPREIADTATSLLELAGHEVDRVELLDHLLAALEDEVAALERGASPLERYRQASWLDGRTVAVGLGSEQLEGRVTGVNEMGSLVLETHAGRRVLASGEVVRVRDREERDRVMAQQPARAGTPGSSRPRPGPPGRPSRPGRHARLRGAVSALPRPGLRLRLLPARRPSRRRGRHRAHLSAGAARHPPLPGPRLHLPGVAVSDRAQLRGQRASQPRTASDRADSPTIHRGRRRMPIRPACCTAPRRCTR